MLKNKMFCFLLTGVITVGLLVGCGNTEVTNESASTEVQSTEVQSTEATHEHSYAEEVTTEATCTEAGTKTFTCECGDTYTEEISALGHDFAEYVSNNDATYEADGTETAKCTRCEKTDTRVAEGSKLTYTFEDMDATKYAKSTVNVRSLPDTDGEKIGGLSQNDEVKVTGKCKETGWYRIEYSGNVAYVNDSYLVDNKVETTTASEQTADQTSNTDSSATKANTDFPYQLFTTYYTPDGKLAYFYMTEEGVAATGEKFLHNAYPSLYYSCNNYNNWQFSNDHDKYSASEVAIWTDGTYLNTKCDDMDGYIATAAANGLSARSRVETPWRTPEGYKIYAMCP